MPTYLVLIGVAFWVGLTAWLVGAVLSWRARQRRVAVLYLALAAFFFLLSWAAGRLPFLQ
jgi:hypothetical protein